MKSEELINFRLMVGLSQPKMATALGYSLRSYQNFESGATEIRNGVGLACAAYALGIREYDGPRAVEDWQKTKQKGKK
jgi:transcriptional regulator with XRE-family HTH domain